MQAIVTKKMRRGSLWSLIKLLDTWGCFRTPDGMRGAIGAGYTVPVNLPSDIRVEFQIMPIGNAVPGNTDHRPYIKVQPMDPMLQSQVFTDIDELKTCFKNPYHFVETFWN
jgi:hypothetical protein